MVNGHIHLHHGVILWISKKHAQGYMNENIYLGSLDFC